MKKLMLACCFVIGAVAMSFAQGHKMPAPADQAKMMQTQLKLSDDQTAKLTTIYEGQKKSMDSVRAAGGDRKAMGPVRKATMEKVNAVLTDDQKAAWKKWMEEHRGHGNGGNGGGTKPASEK